MSHMYNFFGDKSKTCKYHEEQLGSLTEFCVSRTEMSNWILSYLNPEGLVSL